MNLRRSILTITTSAISLLASSQLVVAAEEVHEYHEVLRDTLEEVLRLARERARAATSSGALGHEFLFLIHGRT
jgi:phage terminase Nu1 subunit (DNA packaging protein)